MKKYLLIIIMISFFAQSISAQEMRIEVRDSSGLASSIVSNPLGLLEGGVSGLNILDSDGNALTSPEVIIRGLNSVRCNAMPLIVVDGVMLNSDAADNCDPFWQYSDKERFQPINPLSFLSAGDIESVEVLKNASATTKYGSRGANGVIIIKTKNGLNEGKRLDISSNFGFEKFNLDNNTGISYKGKAGNTRFNISGTFRRQGGTEKGAGNNYGGVLVGLSSRLGKWLNFGVDAVFSGGKTSDKNGNYINDFDNDILEYHGLFSTWFDIHFTKSLSLMLKAGADYQDQVRSVWYGKSTPFGGSHNCAAAKQSSVLLGYNASVGLGYDRYFAEKHHFSVGVLGDFYGKKDEYATLNGSNVMTEELRANSLSFLNSHFDPHAFKINSNNIGAMADVHYDYNGIAGADASFRAEFSPRYYGVKPLLMPSGELWWDIHKLFMPQAKGLSSLRIFGGYGVSSLEKTTPYDMIYALTVPDIMPVQQGAEGFHEAFSRVVAKEWHAGINMSFADNLFSIQAQYYDRWSNDNYALYKFGKAVDYKGTIMWSATSTGEIIDSYFSNLLNKGVEVDLKCYPLRSKSATLMLYSTFSYNFNVVSNCEAEILNSTLSRTPDNEIIYALARPSLSLYGFAVDGEGKPLDVTGEGRITNADRIVLGTVVPKYNYSLGAELTAGRFFAEMVLSGASGHKFADYASMIADNATCLSGKYVLDGSYLRLSRVAVKYNIPIKPRSKCFLSAMDVKIGARDIMLLGHYPSMWSCYLGFDLKF